LYVGVVEIEVEVEDEDEKLFSAIGKMMANLWQCYGNAMSGETATEDRESKCHPPTR